MMPTDKLTMRSTTLDKNANEKIAAAVMLKTPAIVVASKMDIRTGSMIFLPQNGAGLRAPAMLASGLICMMLLIIQSCARLAAAWRSEDAIVLH
jgi:hypothetical protein